MKIMSRSVRFFNPAGLSQLVPILHLQVGLTDACLKPPAGSSVDYIKLNARISCALGYCREILTKSVVLGIVTLFNMMNYTVEKRTKELCLGFYLINWWYLFIRGRDLTEFLIFLSVGREVLLLNAEEVGNLIFIPVPSDMNCEQML